MGGFGIVLAIIIFIVKIIIRSSADNYKAEKAKEEYRMNLRLKRIAGETDSKKRLESQTIVYEPETLYYDSLSIAKQKYRFLWELNESISYYAWTSYIESKKHIFSWLENTEEGNENAAKQTAYASLNSIIHDEQLHLTFNHERGFINITFPKKHKKQCLLLLFEMAEHLGAYLLEKGRRIISLLEIKSMTDDKVIITNQYEDTAIDSLSSVELSMEDESPFEDESSFSRSSVIKELKKIAFFDLANDVDKAIKETFKDYEENGCIDFFSASLGRHFSLDGEAVFEANGLKDQIREMSDIFNSMNIDIIIDDYSEILGSVRYLKRDIKINGHVYNGCPATDWSDSAESCIRVINEILENNNKHEKAYLLFSDETAEMILLTEEQFNYLDQLIPEGSEYKPRKI